MELEKRLPGVLRGEDKVADPAEALEFAQMCYFKQFFGLFARFAEEAFAARSLKAEHPRELGRYTAACAAGLADSGRGKDDPPLDEVARAGWRQKARDWLAADLAFWTKEVNSGKTEAAAAVERTLKHWLRDPALAGVRDAAALATLPKEEQEAWRKLWADVAAVLKQVNEKSRPGN